MLKVGHRGAPAHAPENTLLSFHTAFAMGCDALELDVQQCASGELVVIHDRELSRTTNGRGKVAEKTLPELRRLDAGKGERIPLLDEVLREFKNKGTLFLEIKSKTQSAAAALGLAVRQAVKEGWRKDRLIVIGFHAEVLGWVKEAVPEVPLGLTYEKKEVRQCLRDVRSLKPLYLNPPVAELDERVMAFALRHGMKVAAWTARSRAQLARAEALGAHAVMADDPILFTLG